MADQSLKDRLKSFVAGAAITAAMATSAASPVADAMLAERAPSIPPQLLAVEQTPVPVKKRQTIFRANETLPPNAFTRSIFQNGELVTEVLYAPSSDKHLAYHQSTVPNLIMEGRRGTGKSHTMRWDMHLRAMAYPGFKYLILRRTMGELRQSHLTSVTAEMEKLGGIALGVRAGNTVCNYPNGSIGRYGHCETEADIEKYLSAEYHAIVFDEINTFEWDMITRISASCRVPEGSGLIAVVRGGTNPLGVSAETVYRYFVGKDIQPEEDKKYHPDDWGSLHIDKDDCGYVDYNQYDKRFAGLSKAYQDAWQDGTWGVDGAYFDIRPEHLIKEMPVIAGSDGLPPAPALQWPWLHVYRVLDWGWHDPTVCVWIAVLPDGHEIAFAEYSTVRTVAPAVADEVRARSGDMKVIATIAEPRMWDGEKEMGQCLAFEFEDAGIPMTKGRNDRVAGGFAIAEHLNTRLADGLPKLLILEDACPTLIRTLRAMRVDKKNPGRIADHRADHMPIALSYFCMANVSPTRIPKAQADRPWMVRPLNRRVLGSGQVRRHISSR
jgi:hypothetical protein